MCQQFLQKGIYEIIFSQTPPLLGSHSVFDTDDSLLMHSHCSFIRISITFRRMDVSKRPMGYVPEPDLQGIQPLVFEPNLEKRFGESKPNRHNTRRQRDRRGRRMDAAGPAVGRDRNFEPREVTHGAQGPPNRRYRGRFGG